VSGVPRADITYLKKASPTKEEDLESVSKLVGEILRKIKQYGETAVREYSVRFDSWNPSSFEIEDAEIRRAENTVSDDFKKNVEFLRDQMERFAIAQKSNLKDFEIETMPGVHLGQKYIPVESVGVYVPGGRYRLIASAYMSIVPAIVAGVERIVACAPSRQGVIDPHALYAIHHAGANEIYTLGGAQAIASMAFGGGVMKPVAMVTGPGNAFVAEAKRQLFGTVGIDFIAGPSEILIITDDTADSAIVAADLIAQCEHDPNARAILVSTSDDNARKVLSEIERQLKILTTAPIAKTSWETRGEVMVVANYEMAAQVADAYAPEHLEVQTKDWRWFLSRLHNYGSLFLGEEATVAYSDKAVGTNHILPTGRGATYTGGLWVGKYMKNVTYQWMSRTGSLTIAPVSAAISEAEGMIGHAKTAEARMNKYSVTAEKKHELSGE
jgi:sulfopropanediol 3-dehydrogenase